MVFWQEPRQVVLSLVWAVPGDFFYDAAARWMRAQQLHARVAVCAGAACFVNLGLNLGLAHAWSASPTCVPVAALITQNQAPRPTVSTLS